jgi:signal transduction histidine kinase
LAPTMVNLNLSDDDLEELGSQFQPEQLPALIHWLNATYNVYSLFAELNQGAERITGIVKALKTYSYLDQAPVQLVDLHKGLDDTLLILSYKLKNGISVRREYAEELPKILGFGSELNQVWTNLIDNAIDALDEAGVEEPLITLRTRMEEDWVVIEIEDNGPGISEEVQSRMFEPFFTTKPPGVGSGLGLDISYNIVVHKHRGDIKVFSEPGKTMFQIWLPVNFDDCSPLEYVQAPKSAVE